jgi:predicted transcriptional regulator
MSMTITTKIFTKIEALRVSQQNTGESGANRQVALSKGQVHANDRKLLMGQFARDLTDNPTRLAAIGRQVILDLIQDSDISCIESLTLVLDYFLTDDRSRFDFGLSIEFSEAEAAAIYQLKRLDQAQLKIIITLWQYNRRTVPAKNLKEGSGLSYRQINIILRKLIYCGLVGRIWRFDNQIGRYRNFYRLSFSVTDRVLQWGFPVPPST